VALRGAPTPPGPVALTRSIVNRPGGRERTLVNAVMAGKKKLKNKKKPRTKKLGLTLPYPMCRRMRASRSSELHPTLGPTANIMGEVAIASTGGLSGPRARQPWQVPLATMSKSWMAEPSCKVMRMSGEKTGSVLPLDECQRLVGVIA